jgi:PhnB protein
MAGRLTQGVPAHPSIIPILVVRDGQAAIQFYARVFGAVERWRVMHFHRLGHAVLMIGQTPLAVLDEFAEAGILGPTEAPTDAEEARRGVRLTIEVDDVDAVVSRAVAAGATVLSQPTDQWWGVRGAAIRDPFGYRWGIHSIVEELTPEEVQRRADDLGLYPPPAPTERSAEPTR